MANEEATSPDDAALASLLEAFTQQGSEVTAVVDREGARFRAVTGPSEGFGATPKEALATLMRRLPGDAPQPIVIWPYNQGDAFFSDAQQQRLQDLKSRRDTLTAEEQAEMEGLVASAFDATIARTQALPLVKS